ncbi:hypothetical protein JCM3774_006531 [Rhodotorula dairenensis]
MRSVPYRRDVHFDSGCGADSLDGPEWEDLLSDSDAPGGDLTLRSSQPEDGRNCNRTRNFENGTLPSLILLSRHPALVQGSVKSHTGVLVARRSGGIDGGKVDVFLERMGIATRIGMRLLYHGVDRGRFVRSRRVEELLRAWSNREGRRYDDPTNAERRIIAFIRTYRIDCSELAEPDLARYPTLNTFFYRRLRRDARPVAEPDNPFVISSAADCRLTVFRTVQEAHKLWIKGRHFSLPDLLQDPALASELEGGSVAVFRLAPADYHRYHSPVAGKMGRTLHVPGEYYTVNPMVVRDKRFDVFTANKRDVSILQCRHPGTGQLVRVAFVQVGALLVASIRQTARAGQALERGDEVGYFAYGGSTIVAVFPPGCIEWDEDLVRNSEGRNERGLKLETLVQTAVPSRGMAEDTDKVPGGLSTPASTRLSATTTPLPTPPAGKAVRWNEHVDAHVSVPFFSERLADAATPDDLVAEDEVTVAEIRALGDRAGTASEPKVPKETGAAGTEDPFSDRYRLDDVPISLGTRDQDGALQGIIQPVVQKLDVWTDPLETEGLPSLPIASGPGDEEAAVLKEADEQARGLVQGATAFWGTIRKRRDSIRKMRELESDGPVEAHEATDRAPDPPLQPLATLQEVNPHVEAGPPAPSTGILAALMALQKEEHALSDTSNPASAGSSALPTPLASRDPSPAATPRSPISPISPTSPGSQHSAHLELTDDDEVYERERFIARLRQKRASKNALHHASASVALAGKHAAGAAIGWARHPHHHHHGGERGRSTGTPKGTPKHRRAASATRSQASSPSASSINLSPLHGPVSPSSAVSVLDMPPPAAATGSTPLLSAEQRSRSAASLVHLGSVHTDHASHSPAHHVPRAHSHTALSHLVSRHSPPSTPTSPTPVGVALQHRPKLTSELSKRVRRLGDRLGLELETSRTRPDAAQSGAGVFGGLVLSTATLAVPATPTASTILPIANQHGYHVSRVGSLQTSASTTPATSRPPSPDTVRVHAARGRPSPDLGASDPSKRKSLVDLVREEEERDQGSPPGEVQAAAVAVARPPSASAPVSRAPSPGPGGTGGTANAAQMLQERRHRKKRAAFTLQLNDQPPTPLTDAAPDRSGLRSRRPSLTIDTSAPRPKLSPPLPSPTSPGRRRFLGGLSPKSPNQSFSSLHRDYFGSAGALSPTHTHHHHLTPAEREHERAERKAREHAERERREREDDLREWEREKRRRRRAKEKELKRRRVFITAHVAAIIEREEFLLKLARAFMMFGAPSHRLEAQIQATARVLEMPYCAAMYIPSCLLINFGDPATATSDIRFLKQATGLDIGRLKSTYWIYNKVIRDKMGVTEGSKKLDDLMLVTTTKKVLLKNMVVGGLAGAFIMPSAFYGSFIDCLVAIPLGSLLVLVQYLLARNDLYSSLFEIVIACINALVAGALSYTNQFCFYSVAAGSIVLILPGFIFLCGALELANRCLVSGAVRLTYGTLYSLFLGFGLSVGAEIYTRAGRESAPGGDDYTCTYLREGAPWYRAKIPPWFYFLTVPGFLICMALKNGQPLLRRDSLAMVAIGSAGFAANFFSAKAFVNSSALVSFIGSFVVGVLGNVWARMTRESAFVVMIVGIFIQLPSGLANGGLLRFASDSTSTNSFSTAIDAAAGLIQVAVGLTVGLYLAAALMNLVSRRGRGRGAHLSTF